jgi:hypothetical protein
MMAEIGEEEALGAKHPNVAESLNNLAELYDAQCVVLTWRDFPINLARWRPRRIEIINRKGSAEVG